MYMQYTREVNSNHVQTYVRTYIYVHILLDYSYMLTCMYVTV